MTQHTQLTYSKAAILELLYKDDTPITTLDTIDESTYKVTFSKTLQILGLPDHVYASMRAILAREPAERALDKLNIYLTNHYTGPCAAALRDINVDELHRLTWSFLCQHVSSRYVPTFEVIPDDWTPAERLYAELFTIRSWLEHIGVSDTRPGLPLNSGSRLAWFELATPVTPIPRYPTPTRIYWLPDPQYFESESSFGLRHAFDHFDIPHYHHATTTTQLISLFVNALRRTWKGTHEASVRLTPGSRINFGYAITSGARHLRGKMGDLITLSGLAELLLTHCPLNMTNLTSMTDDRLLAEVKKAYPGSFEPHVLQRITLNKIPVTEQVQQWWDRDGTPYDPARIAISYMPPFSISDAVSRNVWTERLYPTGTRMVRRFTDVIIQQTLAPNQFRPQGFESLDAFHGSIGYAGVALQTRLDMERVYATFQAPFDESLKASAVREAVLKDGALVETESDGLRDLLIVALDLERRSFKYQTDGETLKRVVHNVVSEPVPDNTHLSDLHIAYQFLDVFELTYLGIFQPADGSIITSTLTHVNSPVRALILPRAFQNVLRTNSLATSPEYHGNLTSLLSLGGQIGDGYSIFHLYGFDSQDHLLDYLPIISTAIDSNVCVSVCVHYAHPDLMDALVKAWLDAHLEDRRCRVKTAVLGAGPLSMIFTFSTTFTTEAFLTVQEVHDNLESLEHFYAGFSPILNYFDRYTGADLSPGNVRLRPGTMLTAEVPAARARATMGIMASLCNYVDVRRHDLTHQTVYSFEGIASAPRMALQRRARAYPISSGTLPLNTLDPTPRRHMMMRRVLSPAEAVSQADGLIVQSIMQGMVEDGKNVMARPLHDLGSAYFTGAHLTTGRYIAYDSKPYVKPNLPDLDFFQGQISLDTPQQYGANTNVYVYNSLGLLQHGDDVDALITLVQNMAGTLSEKIFVINYPVAADYTTEMLQHHNLVTADGRLSLGGYDPVAPYSQDQQAALDKWLDDSGLAHYYITPTVADYAVAADYYGRVLHPDNVQMALLLHTWIKTLIIIA